MGLAVLQSERLATKVKQPLIWDGKEAGPNLAGTARDAEMWRHSAGDQHVIDFPMQRKRPSVVKKQVENICSEKTGLENKDRDSTGSGNIEGLKHARSMRAMLFTDVRGFSRLMDSEIPIFMDHVLRRLALVCREAGDGISFLNTWGDGLFLTFETVELAANTAIKLQEAFQKIDFNAIGLPERLALRIGGHYGPVHEMEDPFSGQKGVQGAQVTMAAKIEPVTAPGSIYVSEPFACALAVQASGKYIAEQMSHTIRLHKSAQEVPVFNLRAKGGVAA